MLLDAFSLNAVDYLLKPFSFERFKAAVEKLKETDEVKHLSIRADYKLHKINFNDIQLIEGLDDYIQIHLKDSTKITARSSMKVFLKTFQERFCACSSFFYCSGE
ncbi:LytR/AlgR family response regulator transcription factor [Chryseobacterium indoltheticum]|uniref:LytR/AlgR family response regulator transcription factor n=1 Tax=Chryseobacterium indoltheticum TaxID=254 RepID=UPI003F492D01